MFCSDGMLLYLQRRSSARSRLKRPRWKSRRGGWSSASLWWTRLDTETLSTAWTGQCEPNQTKPPFRAAVSQFQSSRPPALHISCVTLIASDVCSIRTQVPCEVDITGYSSMIPVRSECIFHSKCIEVCKTWIKIVYIYRGIWCHTCPQRKSMNECSEIQ